MRNIVEVSKHPAYDKARYWCRKMGVRGTMDDIDFGIPMMAFLSGYDKAMKEMKKILAADAPQVVSRNAGRQDSHKTR